MTRRPTRSTFFPYTTLFRSVREGHRRGQQHQQAQERGRGQAESPQRPPQAAQRPGAHARCADRKSTRLNSSHLGISYAVFCLKKKKINTTYNKITTQSTTIA